MKHIGSKSVLVVVVMAAVTVAADEGNGLWGWNVSAGGNIGFGLKSNLRALPGNVVRSLPPLTPDVGRSKAEAIEAATPVRGGQRVVYGSDAKGDHYVDPDSSWGETTPNETINWRLPQSAVRGDAFVMESGSWGEVSGQTEQTQDLPGADRDVAYGASVDLSHVLWVAEDESWGVDVSFGLTWMCARNFLSSSGRVASRSATVTRGDVETTIPGDFLQSAYNTPEDDNTWGAAAYDGSQTTGRRDFIVDLDRISSVARPRSVEEYSDSAYLHAHGDYQEWEISALLRPWYDVNGWLCVHGALGVGVTRSSFEHVMEAYCNGARVYGSTEEFAEWDVYGVAGLGLLLRAGDFDVSCDGLFRIGQDDMEINGRDVKGTIGKPWAVLRLGLSYAF